MAAIVLGSAVLAWCLLVLGQNAATSSRAALLWVPLAVGGLMSALLCVVMPRSALVAATGTPLLAVLAGVWVVCAVPLGCWLSSGRRSVQRG